MSKKRKEKENNKYIELAAERFAQILIVQIESNKNKDKYNYAKQK